MIIRRAHRPKQFALLDMAIMNDRRLTLEALGVLMYLLSRPDDWRVSVEEMKSRFSVGKDKMQAIMRLLRDCGYARLERIHDRDTGRLIGQGYSIYDEPRTADQQPATEEPPVDHVEASAADVVAAGHHDAIACDREPENTALGETPAESRIYRQPENPTAGKPGSLLNTEKKPNTDSNLSPLPPEAGGGVGLSLWERFESDWDWDTAETIEKARRAFERLDPVDQTHAARFAKAFCDECARRQRRKPNASTWLRDKGWETLARKARGVTPTTQAVIWAGSQQAAAWMRHEGKPKLFMTELTRPDGTKALGCYRPTEWPPAKTEASARARQNQTGMELRA